jgi:hypothetical protein
MSKNKAGPLSCIDRPESNSPGYDLGPSIIARTLAAPALPGVSYGPSCVNSPCPAGNQARSSIDLPDPGSISVSSRFFMAGKTSSPELEGNWDTNKVVYPQRLTV